MAFTRPRAAQIDFDITNITDPLIRLNSGQTGTPTKDVGLVIERGDDTNVAFIWDESTDSFAVINTTEDGSTSGDVAISSYADLTVKKVTQSEQQYTTSNMMKFNQLYFGAANGSYFTSGEYQKVVTIIPSANSQNYQVIGRITAQNAGTIHTIDFNVAMRSETLPALSYSTAFTEQYTQKLIKPQLWHKQTTTAGFIIAFEVLNSTIYGNVTVDIDVVPRTDSQKANVTINTTQNSETTSVDAGYTAVDMTKVYEINGSSFLIAGAYSFPTSDGSADQVLATNGSGTLSFVDAGGGGGHTIQNAGAGLTARTNLNFDGTYLVATDDSSNDQTDITIGSSVVTTIGTQTLTNKTLTSPTINAFSGTGNGSITGTLSIVTTTTDDSLLITTTEDSSSAAPVITLKRNSSSVADADYLGQIKFKGENDADQEVIYAKITGKILDASDGTEDGIIEIAHKKAGSNNISARFRSDSLQLINGTQLTVDGTSTFNGITVNSSQTINMGSNRITSVADPTSAQDAATKAYVDTQVSGGGGAGTVTSISGTGTANGLTLSGTVTTSGSLTLGGTLSITESQISDLGAYATLASNLSDLTNAATARTNLGLGTAATTASSDYATSAQGTLATNALPKSGGTMTGSVNIGSAIGTRATSLSIVATGSSSPWVATTSTYATVASILPWGSCINYIGTGIYYDDGAWVHSADTANNSLFALAGTGANWYSSNNSTSSWNAASNVPLWNQSGQWTGDINTTYDINTGVITGTATAARYADLAEKYTTDYDYEAGTVLVFGGDEEVTQSTQRLDRRVAGIVSTDPAHLMNSELENSVAVGLQGRVPCKVVGEIRKGDMMVTSSTPGHAEAWREESNPPMGGVIGKALENKTGAGADVIEVVVGRL